MNGINGAGGPPVLWSEARNADGRVYYYNTQTKATQWMKPQELMSQAEVSCAAPLESLSSPYLHVIASSRESTMEGVYSRRGKKVLVQYGVEAELMGDAGSLQDSSCSNNFCLQTFRPVSFPYPSNSVCGLHGDRLQQFVAGGTNNLSSFPQQRDRDDFTERLGPERQLGYGQNDSSGPRGPTFISQSNDPDYATFEEGEAAFIKLLRRSNVQPDWTWEQTMRATIKDPQYRALKDPKDRKAAFEKYAVEVRIQEKDRAKERLAKLRSDFGIMLRRHPEIKHYTQWKTARPIIEGETIFRSTNDDTERRQLYEEYIIDLKKANIEREAITRKSAMDELVKILKALDLEPYTRWSEAHDTIQADEKFQGDDKFKTLSKSDILTAFENHIKSLERTFNDERQREKISKARKERQSRDRFIALLTDLKTDGKIRAGTQWMEIIALVQEDARYVAMLGQPGSTPIDLFWDMVEEEERALRLVRNDVLDVLEDKRFEITTKTTLAEFGSVMSTDQRTTALSSETLSLIFTRLYEKVVRRTEEDKHASERHQRRTIDALRSKIKHISNPPVTFNSTWDTIRPRISHSEEFKALESDDLRRQAFDKVIRRLKEKEEDLENERNKDRSGRRDRDRDRDLRNGHQSSSHHHGRRSRSPELDPYEADRRKAMADRERQYHKSGMTGLSPPPRESRDHHERIPSRDHHRLSHYERDRRERDEERERLYRIRGSRGDELDYGGESRAGGRRRRDSDGESGGSTKKRPRRDKDSERRRERTKTPVAVEKEEPAILSGSEEGEMVEAE